MAVSKVDAANQIENQLPQANIANNVNFRNLFFNSQGLVNQRGDATGITTAAYTIDRWRFDINEGTFSVSQSTTVPSGEGLSTSIKLECTAADTDLGTDGVIAFQQILEGQFLQHLRKGTSNAKKTTVSFWVKSNLTGTLTAEIYDYDNTRQISKTFTIDTADTWERKILTFDGDTTGTLDNDRNRSLGFNIWCGAGSNFDSGTLNTSWNSVTTANRVDSANINLASSTDNEIFFTALQWELGETASDIEIVPFDVELQRCKRYFQKSMPYNQTSGSHYGNGYETFYTSDNILTQGYGHRFPVEMRAVPTITIFRIVNGTTGSVYRVSDAASVTASAIQIGEKNIGYFSLGSSSNNIYAYNYKADAELS